jgi:hypothetical protein
MPSDPGRGGCAASEAGTERGTGWRRRFGHLETVAEHVRRWRYSAVSETLTFGEGSGYPPHQLAWRLERVAVELFIDPLNSSLSGVS